MERNELKQKYNDVYDTTELQEHFTVKSFLAPYVLVVEKETGKIGTLQFQDMPRFYFNFVEDK